MEPFTAVAVGSQVLGGVAGFKGNRAAAKQARQIAEYNAQVAENEAVLLARQKRESEARVRDNGRRLYGTAVTSAAKSGVQITGSTFKALADIKYGIEKDAAFIQYASSVEQARKAAEAEQARIEGAVRSASYRTAAVGSLLGGVTGAASTSVNLGYTSLSDYGIG